MAGWSARYPASRSDVVNVADMGVSFQTVSRRAKNRVRQTTVAAVCRGRTALQETVANGLG
jgi:non-homologous end joining protein Ku